MSFCPKIIIHGSGATQVHMGGVATVEVGTVTTGAPGTEAQVTNSGTRTRAVLNFVIPRGADGKNADVVTVTEHENDEGEKYYTADKSYSQLMQARADGLVMKLRCVDFWQLNKELYEFDLRHVEGTDADDFAMEFGGTTDAGLLVYVTIANHPISDSETAGYILVDTKDLTAGASKEFVESAIEAATGDLADLETTDKSNLVGAINEARDRVYDDAGVTPVTYTYTNPLTKKDDSVTLLIREGTLTQIGDDATDAVKIAWNATMYLAAYSQTCLNMPKTQMDNWVTLYRAGLISERFEYQVTTAPIWRESVIYSASQNTLVYQRTGQETVRMYYNLTTDTLESYSAFISPLTRTQKPDGTSSVSQFALAADPTADMQVATKQYVDNAVENAGGRDISLGLSGIMEPGEVPVVKTVDDNGVPTSWGTRYIMDGATGSNSDLVSLLGLNAMMPRVTQNVQKMGINSAKVGQTLKINAVNKAGEPIAWVAADASTPLQLGAIGSYLAVPAAYVPTDGTVWINATDSTNLRVYTGCITFADGAISQNNMLTLDMSTGGAQATTTTLMNGALVLPSVSAGSASGIFMVAGVAT